MKMAIKNSKMFRLIKQGFTKEQIKMEGKYREGEIEEVFTNLDTKIQKVLVLIDEKVPMSEIPNILGLSEYSFKNQLTCYTNRLSSLYNEDIARKIEYFLYVFSFVYLFSIFSSLSVASFHESGTFIFLTELIPASMAAKFILTTFSPFLP